MNKERYVEQALKEHEVVFVVCCFTCQASHQNLPLQFSLQTKSHKIWQRRRITSLLNAYTSSSFLTHIYTDNISQAKALSTVCFFSFSGPTQVSRHTCMFIHPLRFPLRFSALKFYIFGVKFLCLIS